MTVTNITTPANFFHALRRQLARPFRKPLINMSPKSLLRHSLCVSDLEAFEDINENSFYEYYDDPEVTDKNIKKLTRALFCSGKIYYDLLKRKKEEKRDDVAIIRLEQLYPFPANQLEKLLEKYKHVKSYWVQEEAENMGAWQHIVAHYYKITDLTLISRKASASPATGFKKVHEQQQKEIVDKAFMK